jgi:hypothetical protein
LPSLSTLLEVAVSPTRSSASPRAVRSNCLFSFIAAFNNLAHRVRFSSSDILYTCFSAAESCNPLSNFILISIFRCSNL